MRTLILYSKGGCHLCEGLQEKLGHVQGLEFDLQVRKIEANEAWFDAYQYEVPVLKQLFENGDEKLIPRPSPRITVERLERHLQRHVSVT